MRVLLATAPGSWGVEPPGDPNDPPWNAVLDEIAAAGFDGVELGPVGYLPEDPARLLEELERRGLRLAGGYVMQPFHRPADRSEILAIARRTCRVLAGAGARHVVLIEALTRERSATAGRAGAARRLQPTGWRALLDGVRQIAQLAADEFGLESAFHPHAGTYVEFPDEVERLLEGTDSHGLGLCVDTGHALYASQDPAELCQLHARRVQHLHLKDLRAETLARARREGMRFEQAVAEGVFCPLGQGAVDFFAFRDALEGIDYEGWATFEQDRLPHDPRALPQARASIEFLRTAGIAEELVPPARRSGA